MSSERQISGSGSALPAEIIEAAIDWALKIRFNTPDEKTRRTFDRWLESDPRHARAWQQLESLQKGFDVLPAPAIMTVLETVEEKRRSRRISRRDAIKLSVLGGIALASGGWGIGRYISKVSESVTARTSVGGRRTLYLAEGSVIELNTATTVAAEFSLRQRQIRLARGEVLITTGKDSQSMTRRPFFVTTPFGAIQALGTKFSVRILTAATRVCVLEDAVRMTATPYTILAQKGETWEMNSRGIRQITDSWSGATDWVDGLMVARRMPLSRLLDELARYRAGKITWSPRVANLKVSGLYQIHHPDNALQILSQTLPIKLESKAGSHIHISYSAQ